MNKSLKKYKFYFSCGYNITHICNAFSQLPKGIVFISLSSFFSRLLCMTQCLFGNKFALFPSLLKKKKNKGVYTIKEMQVKFYIFEKVTKLIKRRP